MRGHGRRDDAERLGRVHPGRCGTAVLAVAALLVLASCHAQRWALPRPGGRTSHGWTGQAGRVAAAAGRQLGRGAEDASAPCPPLAPAERQAVNGWVDQIDGGWVLLLAGKDGVRPAERVHVPRCWFPAGLQEGDHVVAGEPNTATTIKGWLAAVRRAVGLRRHSARTTRAAPNLGDERTRW